jgi:hypothetical protein
MELNLTKQIQALTIYDSFILKLSSFFLILLFIVGCEKPIAKSIKIDKDRYLLPGAKDKDGCTVYKMSSKSGDPTKMILYYADKDGNYSPFKKKIKNCI